MGDASSRLNRANAMVSRGDSNVCNGSQKLKIPPSRELDLQFQSSNSQT